MTDRRRPLGTSITRDTHERFSTGNREQVRAARAHAEAWYQALRAWETHSTGGELVSGAAQRTGKTGRMQVVGIGSYGGPPVAALRYMQVRTPLGWLAEASVARAMSQSGEAMLEPIRRGAGLASVIHPSGRGWNQPSDRALAYAVAVLTLAVALGDEVADIHLSYLSNARV